MSHKTTMECCRALQDVHGVHVVTHSPFSSEETLQDGDIRQFTSGSSAVGMNQRLHVQ